MTVRTLEKLGGGVSIVYGKLVASHGLVFPHALELAAVHHTRARVGKYAPRPGTNFLLTCQF